jgi:hypothetical protein
VSHRTILKPLLFVLGDARDTTRMTFLKILQYQKVAHSSVGHYPVGKRYDVFEETYPAYGKLA